MFHCSIKMIHSHNRAFHYPLKMTHCSITIIQFPITMIHGPITVFHSNIKIVQCKITSIHCVIAITYCFITKIHLSQWSTVPSKLFTVAIQYFHVPSLWCNVLFHIRVVHCTVTMAHLLIIMTLSPI